METWVVLISALVFSGVCDSSSSLFEARLLLHRDINTNATSNPTAERRQIFATRKGAFLKPFGDVFFIHKPGLASAPGSISFESKRLPNFFLRYKNYKFHLENARNETTDLMRRDSTFKEIKHQSLPGSELLELSGHPGWFLCRDEIGLGLSARQRNASVNFKDVCSLHVAAVGSNNTAKSKANDTVAKSVLPANTTANQTTEKLYQANETSPQSKQVLSFHGINPVVANLDNQRPGELGDSAGTALEEYLPDHSNAIEPVVTDVKTRFDGCGPFGNCSSHDAPDQKIVKHTHHLLETEGVADKANFEKQVIDEWKDKCINLILTNHFGGRYRIVSDVNPTGYKPKGIQFSLKTVFKNPEAHKTVKFHAIYDLDEGESLLLNDQRELIAVPTFCSSKPTPVAVTAKSARDADTVFAVKRKLIPKIPIPDEDEKRHCPMGCKNETNCKQSCPKHCCSPHPTKATKKG